MNKLGFDNHDLLLQNVEHFTTKEGAQRDQIVENYFGIEGMHILIDELKQSLDGSENHSLIDLGAGTGTFLVPILVNGTAKINGNVICIQ